MDREPLGQGKAGAPSLPPTSSPRVMDGAGPRKPQPRTTDWFLLLARRTKSPCTHHSFPGSLLPSVHPPSHSYTPPSSKGNERGSSFRRKCFFLLLLPWRLLSFTCPVSHGDEGGGPKAPSRKGLWGITASILTLDEAMEPRLGIQVSKSDLQDLSCSSTLCSILGETAYLSESQFCHV